MSFLLQTLSTSSRSRTSTCTRRPPWFSHITTRTHYSSFREDSEHDMRNCMRPLKPWKQLNDADHVDSSQLTDSRWLNSVPTARSYRAVHLFRCLDQLGVVASISDLIRKNGANLRSCDLHVDGDVRQPIFLSRSVFAYNPVQWPREQLEADFGRLHRQYHALQSEVHVPALEQERPRVGILFSNAHHCVTELLNRYDSRELPPCEIAVAISNHDIFDQDGFLRRLLDRHDIPFVHIPATKTDRKEAQLLEAVDTTTDLLVLARYMQILSGDFLRRYYQKQHNRHRDIINIHHGLLPSFKGANPYRQAYDKGVKVIGATAHFVTEELDDGPIIEQLTERVSHRDTLAAFGNRTRALERQCLYNAVSYYLDHKIMRYSKDRVAILN